MTQVLDNDDGVVLDYTVELGTAPDGPQLAPAIERVRRRTGKVPRAVTADRGYGQAAVERDLHPAGVRTVAIPRQATPSPAPSWTAGRERQSGAGTGYSPATWPRSEPSPADPARQGTRPAQRTGPFPGSDFFRSK